MKAPAPSLAAGLSLGLLLATNAPLVRSETVDTTPEGVRMLLPRGGIPAVFEPRFVPADEANLPDSAWILGVTLGGASRAYSLNLLNGHEVVNDTLGGRAIAAVW